MADSTTIWAHGIAFQAKYPADFPEVSGLTPPAVHFIERAPESGSTFVSSTPFVQFFYVSIPTPAVLNEFRMRLFRAYIFYETLGATIRSVSVYDGTRLVRTFANLNWTGNHSIALDGSNLLTLQASENIFSGVGIFVEVDFSDPLPPIGTASRIRFAAAAIQLLQGERLRSTVIQRLLTFFEKLIADDSPNPP